MEGRRVQPRPPDRHKLEVIRVGILAGCLGGITRTLRLGGKGFHVGRLVGDSHLHLQVDQHVRKPLQHTLHEAFGRLRAGGRNRRRAPLALDELRGHLCSHRQGRQSSPHGTGSAGLQRIGRGEEREERSQSRHLERGSQTCFSVKQRTRVYAVGGCFHIYI